MAVYDGHYGWVNELRGLWADAPAILLYSGERGNCHIPKWFFYAFYPGHLLILALLSRYVF